MGRLPLLLQDLILRERQNIWFGNTLNEWKSEDMNRKWCQSVAKTEENVRKIWKQK